MLISLVTRLGMHLEFQFDNNSTKVQKKKMKWNNPELKLDERAKTQLSMIIMNI